MITQKIQRTLISFFLTALFSCSTAQGDLLEDLKLVECINRQVNYQLPVFYNHLQQGGYINMPSARMGCVGEFGAGFAWVPPYHVYSLRCQYFSHLEGTFNYRVFRGIKDPILSDLGFGDRSDKGINLKFAIIRPEDSEYLLPGIAVGIDDFIGTKAFCSRYVVATQVFPRHNLEISLGVGTKRIHGVFGGALWMPFRSEYCNIPALHDLALCMEYDAIPYHDKKMEPHKWGRKQDSKLNWGLKYRMFNFIDLSLSYVRGRRLACSFSTFYNFGESKGFVAKSDDPLPYRCPVVTEPIGPLRPEEALVADLIYGFREQCLDIRDISLMSDDCGERILRISVMNWTYLFENDLRNRLNNLVAYLVPEDITQTIIVVNIEGFPVQEYHYNMEFAKRYGFCNMGPYELAILTPLNEVTCPTACYRKILYHKHHEYWNFELLPKTNTFFGSAKGKFKYAFGLNAALNGYLPYDIYYSTLVGVNMFSSLGDLGTVDLLNPSPLIQVRTDIVRYLKKTVNFEEAYLQKTWALGKGFFMRTAGGYFEIEYGGVAGEVLYYPLNSCWAIGIEGAALMKRKFSGLGFTSRIGKTNITYDENNHVIKTEPSHRHFHGAQYFLDIYYDWREMGLGFKIQTGKFLANDVGVRGEITRYFPSGVDITLWFTYTDGRDFINGSRYYDKGVMISMPLDFFYTYSSRKRWNYGMSAWLRDVGQMSYTGESLYQTIHDERR